MRARKHILGRFLAYLLLCATVVTVLSSCGVKAADIDNTLKPMEASDKNMATESIINPDTHQRAVDLIAAGRLELKKLITHTFDPEHLEEAILCQMGSESIKVLVKPSQDD